MCSTGGHISLRQFTTGTLYEEKNLDRIEVYCRKDVATVANVLLSYLGEPIVSDQDLVMV